MAGLDENPFLELGRTPVPGAAPCGVDPADDEDYIFVVGELSKLDRIESEEPDWFSMEIKATGLLRDKSKDVEIASSLGYTLFKRHGYAGLSASLGLLTELIKTFWDGLFPERHRRRKARIETLCDRYSEGGWFAANQPKGDDFDALDQCLVRIEELKTALTERMADDPPDFSKFVRGLKELAGKRPKPQAAPDPAAAPSGGGGGGGFALGEVQDVSGAENAVLKAANFFEKANKADPVPYALVRVIKWSSVLLPATDEAKYQIEPPDATLVDALKHQLTNALWDHLLENAESSFRSQDPFWLDLQRYVCAALKGLGPQFELAAAAVTAQTAGLVRRLGPGLFDLRFRGGTPLCSAETRAWIEAEVAPPAGGAGGGGAAANGELTEAESKARGLLGAGKLKEALAEMQSGLARCAQRRDRLMWRLRIAQICYDAQRLSLAAPLLEDCHQDLQRYHIAEWEPTLAVDVAQLLYRCRKALATGDKQADEATLLKMRESFAWLCQLDPLAALAVEPAGN